MNRSDMARVKTDLTIIAIPQTSAATSSRDANCCASYSADATVSAYTSNGQGVVMICAAQSSQIAFERREEDFSVMTYYLLRHMQQSRGPVTLRGVFRYLEVKVPAYINGRFPGTAQTPVMVSHLGRELYLRP